MVRRRSCGKTKNGEYHYARIILLLWLGGLGTHTVMMIRYVPPPPPIWGTFSFLLVTRWVHVHACYEWDGVHVYW